MSIAGIYGFCRFGDELYRLVSYGKNQPMAQQLSLYDENGVRRNKWHDQPSMTLSVRAELIKMLDGIVSIDEVIDEVDDA